MKSPTIQYHKIDNPTPDTKVRGAFMSPRRFASQMAYLRKRDFEFYFASEFITFFRDYGRFPAKGLCLTLDDGWKDNYSNAFPVIKELDIKATIYVIPNCIGAASEMAVAEGENEREHLSEANIREMAKFGVEFGSHSMNHRLFNRIEPGEIDEEVVGSKNYLENLLQTECRTFAYPAGFYTDYAKDAVKRAGYLGAFSTIYGSDDEPDIYALNRSEIVRRYGRPFQFPRRIRSIFSSHELSGQAHI